MKSTAPARGVCRLGRPVRLGLVLLLVLGLAATGLSLPVTAQGTPDYAALRAQMVREQLKARKIEQPEVLAAMGEVPRHLFCPEAVRDEAYGDHPLPLDRRGQTISQPYIVALMTELLDLDSNDRVLEVGTGSGYHSAVLSRIAKEVYSVEIDGRTAAQAEKTLEKLGYDNVHIRVGDGFEGWPQEAPFDAIILSAAPEVIPSRLLAQLEKDGGKIVVPVGGFVQELKVITLTKGSPRSRTIAPVRFMPMIKPEAEPPPARPR